MHGANAGRVILVLRRWSPAAHRWVRVARLVRGVRAGRFAATFPTRAAARYRLDATYRSGALAGISPPQLFLS